MKTADPQPAPDAEILIVEDSPTQAERLKFVLEEGGYRHRVARNGREALDAIARQRPTLVISDVVMPEMDGYDLCRHLKRDPELATIPFILLTTLSDPIDVVKGLECDADDFVFKPYDDDYLLIRITATLTNSLHAKEVTPIKGVEIKVAGRTFTIRSNRERILNLLLSTYEAGVARNREVASARDELRKFSEQLELRVRERTSALEAEIIEHKKSTDHIHEQAEILDKANDAIIITNLDGKIKYWNEGATRILGWSSDEAVGRTGADLFGEKLHKAMHALKDEASVKGVGRGEFVLQTKDARKINIEVGITLVRDEAGQPKALLEIITDTTEKKKVEAQFLRSQRMESIGTLAGGVAHDLNNVLAPIMMSAELLRMRVTDPQTLKIINMVESSAQRGTKMVKQVLTFARGAEGEKSTLQLRHLINDMENIIKDTFPKNIQVRIESKPDLWSVAGDPTQLHQVLLNLCVNARDAMPGGGKLTIAANNIVIDENEATQTKSLVSGRHVCLQVTDTGSGIPKEAIDKIFDPFFTTKEIGYGTGLGLSTVHAIIKAHGGILTVSSELGQGTTFKIHLPPVQSAESIPDQASTELPRGRGESVLVVDDEEPVRSMVQQTLEAFGYRVLTAANGADAIATLAQYLPTVRLVLTDMMMPIMDGPATIAAVRVIAPDLPIIAASGLRSKDGAARAADMKVEHFLAKPFGTKDLLEIVHHALRAKPDGAAE
jgi:PAS domain S-box-containing protein